MSEKASLSIRIDLPGGRRFGPGKAALLEAIARTGSIRAAAESLAMSYPKALKLIEQMNSDFESPLIVSRHGGREHGGSQLTELGRWVLGQYRNICMAADSTSDAMLKALQRKLS